MPTIGGNPVVGQTLTVTPGAWTEGTTFTYLWYADGKVIDGATGPTLALTATEKGHEIWVTAVGSMPGYAERDRDLGPDRQGHLGHASRPVSDPDRRLGRCPPDVPPAPRVGSSPTVLSRAASRPSRGSIGSVTPAAG